MTLFPSIRLDRVKEHTFLPALVPMDGVVVDLGANKGDFSHTVSRRYGWQCYAVEANPRMWEAIPAAERVVKINAAVLDKDGPVQFDVSDNPEASSLSSLNCDTAATRITVEGVRLRTLLDRHSIARVDLLKVDIEGAELALFDAMTDDEIASVGQICVEFHELTGQTPRDGMSALFRRVRRLGFVVYKMSVRHYGDVLFVNRLKCRVGPARSLAIRLISRNVCIGKRIWRRWRPRAAP
ncbi:MAG: FkbM family methyltransferase, partial [Phycisphaerae bacterium]